MKPYYDKDGITIYNGDCLDIMQTLEPNSFDLVLTDPPYGMDYQSGWRAEKHKKIILDDSIDWFEKTAFDFYKLLKENTHLYVFCNDYAISHFRDWLEKSGFINKRTLVWVKNNHTLGDLDGDFGNKTEFIIFAHKGRRLLNGKRETNVINASRVDTSRHPTEKPENLISYLIKKSTNQNDLILDPFMGSGTTLVAAKKLKRRAVGIELSEQYCQIAVNRLENTLDQGTLF